MCESVDNENDLLNLQYFNGREFEIIEDFFKSNQLNPIESTPQLMTTPIQNSFNNNFNYLNNNYINYNQNNNQLINGFENQYQINGNQNETQIQINRNWTQFDDNIQEFDAMYGQSGPVFDNFFNYRQSTGSDHNYNGFNTFFSYDSIETPFLWPNSDKPMAQSMSVSTQAEQPAPKTANKMPFTEPVVNQSNGLLFARLTQEPVTKTTAKPLSPTPFPVYKDPVVGPPVTETPPQSKLIVSSRGSQMGEFEESTGITENIDSSVQQLSGHLMSTEEFAKEMASNQRLDDISNDYSNESAIGSTNGTEGNQNLTTEADNQMVFDGNSSTVGQRIEAGFKRRDMSVFGGFKGPVMLSIRSRTDNQLPMKSRGQRVRLGLGCVEDYAERQRIRRYRNRIAAKKCREKKLSTIKSLEQQKEVLINENKNLENVLTKRRNQLLDIKIFLLKHRFNDCKINKKF